MYSVDCEYFKEKFETVDELVEAVLEAGLDPNYMILQDGVPIGETVFDIMVP